MKKNPLSTLMVCIFFIPMLASSEESKTIAQLAKELNLYGGSKATIQWKRIFSSPRHLKRYNLEHLDRCTREELEKYLIEHAADSEQPIVPGLL